EIQKATFNGPKDSNVEQDVIVNGIKLNGKEYLSTQYQKIDSNESNNISYIFRKFMDVDVYWIDYSKGNTAVSYVYVYNTTAKLYSVKSSETSFSFTEMSDGTYSSLFDSQQISGKTISVNAIAENISSKGILFSKMPSGGLVYKNGANLVETDTISSELANVRIFESGHETHKLSEQYDFDTIAIETEDYVKDESNPSILHAKKYTTSGVPITGDYVNTVSGTAAAEVSRFAPKNILVTSDVYLDKNFSVNDKNIVGANHIIKFVVKGALSDTALFDINQNSFRDALVVGVADARNLRNTASLLMTFKLGTHVKVSNVSVYGSIRNVKYTLNKTIYPVSSVNDLGTNINSNVTVNVLDATIAGEKGITSSDVSVKISEKLDETVGTNNNILISGDGMDGQNASENNEPKKGGNAGTVTIKNNGLLPKFYRSGVNGIGGYSLSGKYIRFKDTTNIFTVFASSESFINDVSVTKGEQSSGSVNGTQGNSLTGYSEGGTIREVSAQSSETELKIGIGSFGRIYATLNKSFTNAGDSKKWKYYDADNNLTIFGELQSNDAAKSITEGFDLGTKYNWWFDSLDDESWYNDVDGYVKPKLRDLPSDIMNKANNIYYIQDAKMEKTPVLSIYGGINPQNKFIFASYKNFNTAEGYRAS
ncbi:MAG: hypothetical protein IJ817_02575, partial [Clostridia bacterium]|nr:hypothetical protein [Clostridia bacterium]